MGMDDVKRFNIVVAAAQYLEERLLNTKIELREQAALVGELQDKLRLEGERIGMQADKIKELQEELDELAARVDNGNG